MDGRTTDAQVPTVVQMCKHNEAKTTLKLKIR